jgi:hypothetical protein
MAPQSVFYQGCPVCGRSLRMPVQCFGRQVTCVHCGGEFRADEPSRSVLPLGPDSSDLPRPIAGGPLAVGSLAARPQFETR